MLTQRIRIAACWTVIATLALGLGGCRTLQDGGTPQGDPQTPEARPVPTPGPLGPYNDCEPVFLSGNEPVFLIGLTDLGEGDFQMDLYAQSDMQMAGKSAAGTPWRKDLTAATTYSVVFDWDRGSLFSVRVDGDTFELPAGGTYIREGEMPTPGWFRRDPASGANRPVHMVLLNDGLQVEVQFVLR